MTKTLCLFALTCIAFVGCQPTETAQQPATEPSNEPALATTTGDAIPAGIPVATQGNTATLKAKFVYGGKAPERPTIDGSKDAFCADAEILNEKMLVGKDGGLKNLALIFDTRKSEAEIPEAMLEAPEAEIVLDNKGCVFEPHVFFARPGQTVKVTNSDETGHNANFLFFTQEGVNFLVPGGGFKKLLLEDEEPAPIPVECNVHPWMKAYIIVQQHPYVGITNAAGELVIEDLPPGEVTFRVWHENAERSIDEGTVGGEKQKWSRGRMEVELKPGVNDLGTITLDPSLFKDLD